jgi:hypothetical protein
MVEKCQVAQHEKDDLHTKFEEERVQVKQEKENLLTEQLGVKEVVIRALHSMTGLEKKAKEPME